MFLYSSEELLRFFLAQGIALLLCLFYDLLKSLEPKSKLKHINNFFDAFLWFIICVTFLILWQNYFDGEIRFYTLSAFCLSVLLYYLTIHKPVFLALCITAKKIYSFFDAILKILLTVWHFFSKIFMYLLVLFKTKYSVNYEDKNHEKKHEKI